MNKIIGYIIGIVAFTIFFTISAYATVLDDARVIDARQGIFSVRGTLEPAQNNRNVSIFVLQKNKTLADLQTDIDNILAHVGVALVNYDGSYEYTFKFDAVSNDYVFYAVYKDQIKFQNIFYANWAEVEQFFVDISKDQLTDDQIFDDLKKYSVSIGIDMTAFDNDVKKAIVIKRIRQNKVEIGTEKQEQVVAVLAKAVREINLLSDLQNISIWNQVFPLLNSTTDLTGISFTEYHNVRQKQNVDSKLIKKTFANADEIKNFFDRTVSDELSRQDRGTGSTGGGGGGGTRTTVANTSEIFPVKQPEELKPVFSDLKDVVWAKDAIEALYLRNIVSGVNSDSFSPNGNILREEFVKIVVLAFDMYNKNAKSEFTDVKPEDWSYSYISSAKDASLIFGSDDGLFKKGEFISRQDLAVILYRVATKKGLKYEIKKEDFKDFDKIDSYAVEAVSYLAGAKIINGLEDGNFAPEANATRAQTALLVYSMMGGIK